MVSNTSKASAVGSPLSVSFWMSSFWRKIISFTRAMCNWQKQVGPFKTSSTSLPRMGRNFRDRPRRNCERMPDGFKGVSRGREGRSLLLLWSRQVANDQWPPAVKRHSLPTRNAGMRPLSDEAINGRWVNTQEFSDFVEGENFVHQITSLVEPPARSAMMRGASHALFLPGVAQSGRRHRRLNLSLFRSSSAWLPAAASVFAPGSVVPSQPLARSTSQVHAPLLAAVLPHCRCKCAHLLWPC